MSIGTLQLSASPSFAHPSMSSHSDMASLLKDNTQPSTPSTSGPRFRPYASPKHHVTKGRYITSNDPRGYIPVYEYPLNGQWIMMDIDDGYILWTGIWKALGNSKADIVKMIESQPDLAPLIRRVRGGYLKIQGTWMPYEVALKLSRRVAWSIRDELIPLFGPTFPSTCLSPDQPGYGQVIPSGQVRRRSRKTAQNNAMMQHPPAPSNWTVVTPASGLSHHHQDGSLRDVPPALPPLSIRSPDYSMPPYAHSHLRGGNPADMHHGSPISPLDGSRYGSFTRHPPSSYRKPMSPSRMSLSVDTHSLSLSERSSKEELRLPPIQSPSSSTPISPYALPPISAMEDLRGSVTQDSAAVLRRLRMDDDDYPSSRRNSDASSLGRRHSSAQLSSPRSSHASPRFQPYHTSHSLQEHSTSARTRSPSAASLGATRYHPSPRADLYRQGWSDASHEGDSTSNPSPTSPTTPNSLSDSEEKSHSHYGAHGVVRGKQFYGHSRRLSDQWSPTDQYPHSGLSHPKVVEPERLPMRRDSFEMHSDSESSQPHRPW